MNICSLGRSQQRRGGFCNKAQQPALEWLCWEQIQRDFPAFTLCLFKIVLDLGDTVRSPQIGRAFKVMIEAAVVQIHGAHRGIPPVHHKVFGVDEARRVLVDLHPRLQQRRIVGLGHLEHGALVRDVGG